jgi:MoaA/NifB/PqqE/SkfB family radical SAM enzyme
MKSTRELEHRIKQTTGVASLKDTLRNVEINVTDSCNRTCNFCPHSMEDYQFSTGRGDLNLFLVLKEQLKDYHNSITLCGYGEPTMNKQLPEIIKILRETPAKIELTTNGELLTKDKVKLLFDKGLDFINISVYELEHVDHVNNLVKDLNTSQYMIRDRYLNQIKIVDRKAIINNTGNLKTNKCYLPSYKMMVNYDGTVFLCCNDWSRTNTYGNVFDTDIFTIWLENMNSKRMELLNGNRSGTCSYCDIDGTDYGKESILFFTRTNETS